jgi:negative regulator of flagellin synthesis FlgM
MEISGVGPVHGPHSINPAHLNRSRACEGMSALNLPCDEVEISPMARMLEQVHSLPDVRASRVAALREAIDAGSYDTHERLSLALDRMIDELV